MQPTYKDLSRTGMEPRKTLASSGASVGRGSQKGFSTTGPDSQRAGEQGMSKPNGYSGGKVVQNGTMRRQMRAVKLGY